MPWDCFCPECGGVVIGNMTEDHDEMKKQWEKLKGQKMECQSCGCIFIFDTDQIVKKGRRYMHVVYY